MAPEQCPACGRFLSKQFVRATSARPRACPRCGELVGDDEHADPHPLDDWDRGPTAIAPRAEVEWPSPVVGAGVGALVGAGVGTLVGPALGRRRHPVLGATVGAAAGALLITSRR